MLKNTHLKFDKQFFRDFWSLFKPYWTSEEKWPAIGLISLNIICIIIGVRASIGFNDFSRDFYNALQTFNGKALTTALWHFVFIVTITLITYGYAFYFNSLLSIRWRRWLTKHYLKNWLNNQNHYRMQLLNNHIDNPDQRISEDLESFPEATLSLFFMFFESSLTLVSFGYILWKLSGNLTIPIGSMHVTLPGYLIWAALLYGLLGTWINNFIGKKLASLDYQQQFFNADFRFSLVRLRESSEQIALYKGEPAENNKFMYLFSRIFSNFMNIATLRKRLMFFTSGYNTVAYMLGILLSIPLYLQKKIQLGGMMQISGAFSSVIQTFSIFINAYNQLAEWRAVVSRLTEFNKSMNHPTDTLQSKIHTKHHPENDIVINNLKLLTPKGDLLLEKINLTLKGGDSILISGHSGIGKSTLLRSLAGIWPYGEGQILLPQNQTSLFLPQKPYLPLGSFKEILLYPTLNNIDEKFLQNLLVVCRLNKFAHRLDEIKNWAQELSLGEQQLVSFVRVFLQKPDLIFLDEATSALDEQIEAQLYEHLRAYLPNATIISVGHRTSLTQFHHNIVTLEKTDHTISPMEELVASA